MSLDLASAVICGDGSEPMDKIHTSGVCGSDSSRVFSRSRMHASPYSGPNESTGGGENKPAISNRPNRPFSDVILYPLCISGTATTYGRDSTISPTTVSGTRPTTCCTHKGCPPPPACPSRTTAATPSRFVLSTSNDTMVDDEPSVPIAHPLYSLSSKGWRTPTICSARPNSTTLCPTPIGMASA